MSQNAAHLLKMYRALLNGKLQIKNDVSGWVDTNSMILNSDDDDLQNYYRRKPDPSIHYIASWEDEDGVLRFSKVYVTKKNLEFDTFCNRKNFKIHELNRGE